MSYACEDRISHNSQSENITTNAFRIKLFLNKNLFWLKHITNNEIAIIHTERIIKFQPSPFPDRRQSTKQMLGVFCSGGILLCFNIANIEHLLLCC